MKTYRSHRKAWVVLLLALTGVPALAESPATPPPSENVFAPPAAPAPPSQPAAASESPFAAPTPAAAAAPAASSRRPFRQGFLRGRLRGKLRGLFHRGNP